MDSFHSMRLSDPEQHSRTIDLQQAMKSRLPPDSQIFLLVRDREHIACKRNRDLGKSYQHLSLETIAEIEYAQANFADTDSVIDSAFEKFRSNILLETLRKALVAWKPRATDLLDLYLLRYRKDCTDILAKKYGVSSRMVRKYKRQFEEFVKNFFD